MKLLLSNIFLPFTITLACDVDHFFSATVPVLFYYTPSLALCKNDVRHIPDHHFLLLQK